ncbi:MAG: transglycosylase SLT domain-containing protein [Deltaproteobacteria bacterium]|nr:transglycosylase SLT domain-containing protein [Deltaproteobacteria bacterium]
MNKKLVVALVLLFLFPSTILAISSKETLRSGVKDDAETFSAEESSASSEQKNGEADDIFEEALELVDEANELIEEGKTAKAIKILDRSYRMMLSGNENNRQQDDLRLAISQSITHAYGASFFRTKGLQSEIPLPLNADVEAEIRSFQTRERSSFIAAYHRSFLYRPLIVAELRRAGIPEELSWLPLVESGFKVNAYSRARALGLWQFIPSTGYRYGLERDIWIDERMDPTKSTVAAIAYLRDLHHLFGDWLTVLAAYNCGEGRVMRTITRGGDEQGDYFWDMYSKLPRETARYVPRFIATLHIVKDPEKYGFELPADGTALEDHRILTTNKTMQLTAISKLAGIADEILISLNPELRLKATPDREYSLRVPKENYAHLEASIDSVPQWRHVDSSRAGVSFVRHRISSGDTLTSIARRYGTTVSQIREHNASQLRRGLIAGKTIMVPVRRIAGGGKQKGAIMGDSYTVKKGDTLSTIAKRSGIAISVIQQENGLTGNIIRPGQVLKLR